MAGEMITVGWLERVSLPEWGIEGLVAKIDTGARTSSIHAESIEEVGEGRVRFEVVVSRSRRVPRQVVETEVARKTVVRSSSGRAQARYVVKTDLVLGGVHQVIEVTLSSRKSMTRRMLLGRRALSGVFVVDVSGSYLLEGGSSS